jgi:ribosomal protein S18 acetylase RimI-like enzyme
MTLDDTFAEKSHMTIRPAELEDLNACLALDHSYVTEHVWQMEVHEGNELVAMNFRTMRLPRPVHVQYPRDRNALLADWRHRDCFLVAILQDSVVNEATPRIVGYLTMAAHDWHKTGWVADLVVAPENRRQGIATELLHKGADWAHKAGLRRLTVETQTKNYPAICFLERQGFSFCGCNDRYYANHDIALFFALDLY